MLFVTQLRVLPGQWEDATRLFKHPKLPNNVMVHEFLGLLGKPDAIVIFEAPVARPSSIHRVPSAHRLPRGSVALAVPVECPSEREKRRGRRGGRGVAAPAHHRELGSQRFGRRPAPHDIKGLLYAREIPMLE